MSGKYGGVDEPYESHFPEFPPGLPGVHFAMEADVTVYWPSVRPCWDRDQSAVEYAEAGA